MVTIFFSDIDINLICCPFKHEPLSYMHYAMHSASRNFKSAQHVWLFENSVPRTQQICIALEKNGKTNFLDIGTASVLQFVPNVYVAHYVIMCASESPSQHVFIYLFMRRR